MKHLIYVFFFAFILVTLSCSEDSLVNPIDQMLQKNIIGTWENNNGYKITYYVNNTFVDTLVQIHPLVDTAVVVRSGKYSIVNSILSYDEFSIDTFVSKEIDMWGYNFYDSPMEIFINDRTLTRNYVMIFDNVGAQKTEVWDKWETKRWFAQYSLTNDAETYYGDLTATYDFIQDSGLCVITTVYHNVLNDSLFEYQTRAGIMLRYNEVYFYSSYAYSVKFKDKKMYLYAASGLSNLTKVD